MQLTAFTDYSLRTLMYLTARPDTLSTISDISDYYGISRNHLVKVVHRLSQLSYIETTRGKGGGIKISPQTKKLRLGDVITTLEPDMRIAECFDVKTNTCKITGACKLKHFLSEANQSFINTLNAYTLADTTMRSHNLFSS